MWIRRRCKQQSSALARRACSSRSFHEPFEVSRSRSFSALDGGAHSHADFEIDERGAVDRQPRELPHVLESFRRYRKTREDGLGPLHVIGVEIWLELAALNYLVIDQCARKGHDGE